MNEDNYPSITRRKLLGVFGSLGAAGGLSWYNKDKIYNDTDSDGIPDKLEESEEFEEHLNDIYEDDFEGLDPDRKDLLIDARYIGDASVSNQTKNYIEDLFRQNDINAQWLDYGSYDEGWFSKKYGAKVGRILSPKNSFYANQVEEELQDIALQLIVLPDNEESGRRKLLNEWEAIKKSEEEAMINGTSLGNRAVIAEREEESEETRLILHELSHLALCHDYDNPENKGVMGSEEKLDLMDHEWEKIRDNLDNVRDTTGIDTLGRKCLIESEKNDVLDEVEEFGGSVKERLDDIV